MIINTKINSLDVNYIHFYEKTITICLSKVIKNQKKKHLKIKYKWLKNSLLNTKFHYYLKNKICSFKINKFE